MIFRITALLAMLVLSACASMHPGERATTLEKPAKVPMNVSALTTSGSKKDVYQLVEITLENTSENWVKISRAEVLLEDTADPKNVSMVLGKDLKDWSEALMFKQKLTQQNLDAISLTAVVAGAALTAIGSSNSKAPAVSAIGLGLMGGGLGWAAWDGLNMSIDNANQTSKVPASHLYQPFAVPGKMFLRRWILLNKPSGSMVKQLNFELETIEGVKERYAVKL